MDTVQVPGKLHGRRKRRSHERMSPFGSAGHCATPQGTDADANHMPVPEEGKASSSAAAHGGRSSSFKDFGNGTHLCQIFRVSASIRFELSNTRLSNGVDVSFRVF